MRTAIPLFASLATLMGAVTFHGDAVARESSATIQTPVQFKTQPNAICAASDEELEWRVIPVRVGPRMPSNSVCT
jgi:hypothetical protein